MDSNPEVEQFITKKVPWSSLPIKVKEVMSYVNLILIYMRVWVPLVNNNFSVLRLIIFKSNFYDVDTWELAEGL